MPEQDDIEHSREVDDIDFNLDQKHPISKGLSPIQSVASSQTTEPNRNSMMQPRSLESINSWKKNQQMDDQMSLSSSSSPSSTGLARSKQSHDLTTTDEVRSHPSGFMIELNRPPEFFELFSVDSGVFHQCDDFTQASQVLHHHFRDLPDVLIGQSTHLLPGLTRIDTIRTI
jgi:hypothetical protein